MKLLTINTEIGDFIGSIKDINITKTLAVITANTIFSFHAYLYFHKLAYNLKLETKILTISANSII